MNRRAFLALGAATAFGRMRAGAAQSRGDTQGAAKDFLYQALERLSEHASVDDVQAAVRLLQNALDEEPSFGDAHYYRYLCLKHLNRDAVLQRTHREAAERYESEALRDGRDPFVLAVPRIYDNLPNVGQKWALVVGVSQFRPDAGAERLQSAAADAEAFATLLKDPKVGRFPPGQVLLLTNEQATTANIKARLNTIARRAKPEDVVLTYISTHGSPRSDDLRQVSYLYTYDTDVTSRDQIFGSALPMVEVSGTISTRCVAQRTIAIFDTCHSGSGVASTALSTTDMDRLREGAGRYIISSCQAEQKSYEDAGHGFFTASLIDNLTMKQGCVRLKELFADVQKDVSGRAAKLGKEQRPVMASSESASEILVGIPVGGASDQCAGS